MSWYEEPELPQECKDRAYWHKRFSFASWLFLIMGIYFIFASGTPWSALLSIATSLVFRVIDEVNVIRHLKWHYENNERNH